MICQYQLELRLQGGDPIPPAWAYRLYAWLLSEISEEYAELFHQNNRAISQYIDHGTWMVNLFGEEVIEVLGNVLEKTGEISLHEDHILVVNRKKHLIPGPMTFLQQGREVNARRVSLTFTSPTAFKQSGHYTIFPKEELIIQSLLMRWNECFPECSLEDDDMTDVMRQGIHMTDYRLQSTRFKLKDVWIPSFYGRITLDAKLPVVVQEIWNALLCFAPYTGIGIKTTLGMGGVELADPQRMNSGKVK